MKKRREAETRLLEMCQEIDVDKDGALTKCGHPGEDTSQRFGRDQKNIEKYQNRFLVMPFGAAGEG